MQERIEELTNEITLIADLDMMDHEIRLVSTAKQKIIETAGKANALIKNPNWYSDEVIAKSIPILMSLEDSFHDFWEIVIENEESRELREIIRKIHSSLLKRIKKEVRNLDIKF